jgi:hypothetical protein
MPIGQRQRGTVRCQSLPPTLASVPEYTYFQNLVIQAAHFSYPEAFALAGRGVQTLDTALYINLTVLRKR